MFTIIDYLLVQHIGVPFSLKMYYGSDIVCLSFGNAGRVLVQGPGSLLLAALCFRALV